MLAHGREQGAQGETRPAKHATEDQESEQHGEAQEQEPGERLHEPGQGATGVGARVGEAEGRVPIGEKEGVVELLVQRQGGPEPGGVSAQAVGQDEQLHRPVAGGGPGRGAEQERVGIAPGDERQVPEVVSHVEVHRPVGLPVIDEPAAGMQDGALRAEQAESLSRDLPAGIRGQAAGRIEAGEIEGEAADHHPGRVLDLDRGGEAEKSEVGG
ncbi:MAG: hypothetical protein DMF79_18730 [Acidobacteria bacterium]|nr:MAG: hypothetical protein DMF79_18730 [Acidobacteriota bacterium]